MAFQIHMPNFDLARKLQAACGVARSFLGPHKALKCVIDESSDAKNCLVGTFQAFLLAADGDPTATTLLLEYLEHQAPASSDGPYAGRCGPGSGATWLAVFCGLLLNRMLHLEETQGVPYDYVRSGVLQAMTECCEAVRLCSLNLTDVAECWDEGALQSYYQGVCALMPTTNPHVPTAPTAPAPAANAPVVRPPPAPPDTAASPPAAGPLRGAVSVAASTSASVMQLYQQQQAHQHLHQPQEQITLAFSSVAVSGGVSKQPDEDFGWFDEMMEEAARVMSPGVAPSASSPPPQQPQQRFEAPVRRGTLRVSARPAVTERSAGHDGQGGHKGDDDEFGWFESYGNDAKSRDRAAAPPPPPRQVPSAAAVQEPSDVLCGKATGSSAAGSGRADGVHTGCGDADARVLGTLMPYGDGDIGGSSNSSSQGGDDDDGDDATLYGGGVVLDETEATVAALEAEVSWFFDEGELAAERQARLAWRELAALGTRLESMLRTSPVRRTATAQPTVSSSAAAAVASSGGPQSGATAKSLRHRQNGSDEGGGQEVSMTATAGDAAGVDGGGDDDRTTSRESGTACASTVSGGGGDVHVARDQTDGGGGGGGDAILGGGYGEGHACADGRVAAAEAKQQSVDPLIRLICGAAAGLAHGRHQEMQLAAAAVLTLLRPLIAVPDTAPRPPPQSTSSSSAAAAAGPGVEGSGGGHRHRQLDLLAERVRTVAAGLQYERCVLTAEISGTAATWEGGGDSDDGGDGCGGCGEILRGVCLPLSHLSRQQAALASTFLQAHRNAGASATVTLTAVFLNGVLQPEHAAHGPRTVTDAADLAAATSAARLDAFTTRVLSWLQPHRIQLLIASGHISDDVAVALHARSDGAVLALGGVGLRIVRAAAAAVCSAAPPLASSLAFLSPRLVVRRLGIELMGGGLSVRDYRPGNGHGHVEPDTMLRLFSVEDDNCGSRSQGPLELPGGCGGRSRDVNEPNEGMVTGWVTAVLRHRLADQLAMKAAAFRTCFNRLVAALKSSRVLPGAGAWELAVAQHMEAGAHKMERQVAATVTATVTATGTAMKTEPIAAHEHLPAPAAAVEGPKVVDLAAEAAVAEAAAEAAVEGTEHNHHEEDAALFQPLVHRALAAALQDLVGVLLQNGGSSYGRALAAEAECARALRGGDVEALRGLAATGQRLGFQGAGVPAAATAGRAGTLGTGIGVTSWEEEVRQLAAALGGMLELRDAEGTAAAAAAAAAVQGCGGVEAEGEVDGKEMRVQYSHGYGLAAEGIVLDELGAREAGVRAAVRLALLAASVDVVIVNR